MLLRSIASTFRSFKGLITRSFTSISRGENVARLSSVTNNDLIYFESLLGKNSVITNKDDLQAFSCDWTGEFASQSKLALLPSSTEQVSAILKYCFEKSLAVVPQGGNTGLVGGGVPLKDEIVLSLKKLNRIIGFDERIGSISCEAGVTLQTADEYARSKGYLMPLDLGSKGSCQVGGNLATNAGGIRLIKYGSLRGNVLGLKVVLSDGRVLDSMQPLRKDNVGYDLKQLFLGSEGTLGVITECVMLTPRKPIASSVALLAVDNFEATMRALVMTKSILASDLSAFEYFDESSAGLVKQYANLQNPLANTKCPFYLVVEACGNDESSTQDKLQKVAERLIDDGIIKNAVMAENVRQYNEIWGLRERITSSLKSSGMRVFKYDVSLPVTLLHEATVYVTTKIREEGFSDVLVFEYGHLGDGNLHFNAACPSKDDKYVQHVRNRIEDHLYGFVRSNQGSISAEHGLGQLKAKKILYSRNPLQVECMKAIKQLFDPKGILNPGKVLV